jgi:hypothetical protein
MKNKYTIMFPTRGASYAFIGAVELTEGEYEIGYSSKAESECMVVVWLDQEKVANVFEYLSTIVSAEGPIF